MGEVDVIGVYTAALLRSGSVKAAGLRRATEP
jgi:hypothetical protein